MAGVNGWKVSMKQPRLTHAPAHARAHARMRPHTHASTRPRVWWCTPTRACSDTYAHAHTRTHARTHPRTLQECALAQFTLVIKNL